MNEPIQNDVQPIETNTPISLPLADTTVNGHSETPNPRVEAGRKGGQRFHQLIQLGLQYERDHGLKRGRQRLRQLIQEGRLYEQEHGLVGKPRRRRPRSEQIVQSFVRSLQRMVKPAYRARLRLVLVRLEAA
jgi:hypothetical protein